jgi:hypothetical protein
MYKTASQEHVQVSSVSSVSARAMDIRYSQGFAALSRDQNTWVYGLTIITRALACPVENETPPKSRHGKPRKPRLTAQRPGQRHLSSRSAAFLMILSSDKQTTQQRQQVVQICQGSSELCTANLLSQECVTLLQEHQAKE